MLHLIILNWFLELIDNNSILLNDKPHIGQKKYTIETTRLVDQYVQTLKDRMHQAKSRGKK